MLLFSNSRARINSFDERKYSLFKVFYRVKSYFSVGKRYDVQLLSVGMSVLYPIFVCNEMHFNFNGSEHDSGGPAWHRKLPTSFPVRRWKVLNSMLSSALNALPHIYNFCHVYFSEFSGC